MAIRFHVNPATGRANKCEAEPGKCPHGENTAHGDTKQEARAAYEAKKTAAGKNLAGGLSKSKIAVYDEYGLDRDGYDPDGYNKDGYHKDGYHYDGYDRAGYDRAGYDRAGYDKYGAHKEGYDEEGYDVNGYDRYGRDKDGYDRYGYDKDGYDEEGYNEEGYDEEGYDYAGYDQYGYNRDGRDRHGYDRDDIKLSNIPHSDKQLLQNSLNNRTSSQREYRNIMEHYSRNVGKLNPTQKIGSGAEYYDDGNSVTILADTNGKGVRAIISGAEMYEDPNNALGDGATQIKQSGLNPDVKKTGLVVVGYIASNGDKYGYIPDSQVSAFVYK